jgi:hypothetical protein
MMDARFRRVLWWSIPVAGVLSLWAISATAQNPATFYPYFLGIGQGTKTATATAGAATLNQPSGTITSEALTTAAGATYTLTITNNTIGTTDQVFASVANGTNSAGTPTVTTVAPGNGQIVAIVRNAHASAAFNGTIKVTFMSLEP